MRQVPNWNEQIRDCPQARRRTSFLDRTLLYILQLPSLVLASLRRSSSNNGSAVERTSRCHTKVQLLVCGVLCRRGKSAGEYPIRSVARSHENCWQQCIQSDEQVERSRNDGVLFCSNGAEISSALFGMNAERHANQMKELAKAWPAGCQRQDRVA